MGKRSAASSAVASRRSARSRTSSSRRSRRAQIDSVVGLELAHPVLRVLGHRARLALGLGDAVVGRGPRALGDLVRCLLGALENAARLLADLIERPADGGLGRATGLEVGDHALDPFDVGVDRLAVVAPQREREGDVADLRDELVLIWAAGAHALQRAGDLLAPAALGARVATLRWEPVRGDGPSIAHAAARESGAGRPLAGGSAEAAQLGGPGRRATTPAGVIRQISAARGGDHEVSVVGQRELEPAVHVRPVVAQVDRHQGGGEVGPEHNDAPLSGEDVASASDGTPHAGRRLVLHPSPERRDERGLGGEPRIALPRGRGEAIVRLERAEDQARGARVRGRDARGSGSSRSAGACRRAGSPRRARRPRRARTDDSRARARGGRPSRARSPRAAVRAARTATPAPAWPRAHAPWPGAARSRCPRPARPRRCARPGRSRRGRSRRSRRRAGAVRAAGRA